MINNNVNLMRFKKQVLLVIVLVIAFVFAGCSSNSPTSIVKAKVEEIKKQISEGITDDDIYSKIGEKMLDFDFEIISETINGDDAIVKAKTKAYDFKTFIAEIIAEALSESMEHIFDTSFDSEKLVEEIAVKKIDELKEKTLETEVNIKLKKEENGWKIDEESEEVLRRAILGGIEDIKDAFISDSLLDSGLSNGEQSPEERNEEIRTYQFWETAQCDGFELGISEFGTVTPGNYLEQPKEGNIIFYFEFDVTNISDSSKSISYSDFDCYVDNYKADNWIFGDDKLAAMVSSGRETKGTVYFEVPESFKTIEIEFLGDSLFDDSGVIFSIDRDSMIYEVEETTQDDLAAQIESALNQISEEESGTTNSEETTATIPNTINEDNLNVSQIGIGGRLSGKYLNFTISDMLSIKENNGTLPRDGYYYLGIEFSIKNDGEHDRMVMEKDFSCYADGVECNIISVDENKLSGTIRTGKTLTGVVAYEIPIEVNSIIIQYTDSLDKEEVLYFKIR